VEQQAKLVLLCQSTSNAGAATEESVATEDTKHKEELTRMEGKLLSAMP
jgi:hypothetical protein